jgi:hypothetical protein
MEKEGEFLNDRQHHNFVRTTVPVDIWLQLTSNQLMLELPSHVLMSQILKRNSKCLFLEIDFI